VPKDEQYETETARLKTQAAEWRLRVVDAELSLAVTLCALAETEIRYARPDEARKLLNRIVRLVETMRIHIDEPNHLPTIAIADIRQRLTQLTTCTEEIESKLRLQDIRSA